MMKGPATALLKKGGGDEGDGHVSTPSINYGIPSFTAVHVNIKT